MELAAAEPAAGAVAEVPAAQEDLLADIEGLDDVDWDACGDALSWDFLKQVVGSGGRSAGSPPASPVDEVDEAAAATREPDAPSSSTGAGALSIVPPQPAQQPSGGCCCLRCLLLVA